MTHREGWKITIPDIDLSKSTILPNWWYSLKGAFNVHEFVPAELHARSGGLSNHCDSSSWRGYTELLHQVAHELLD